MQNPFGIMSEHHPSSNCGHKARFLPFLCSGAARLRPLRLSMCPKFRVLSVPFPFLRVLCNVSTRVRVLFPVAQHTFKIIALPDWSVPTQFLVCPLGNDGFERANDCTKRARENRRLAKIARRKGAAVLRPYKWSRRGRRRWSRGGRRRRGCFACDGDQARKFTMPHRPS